MARLYFLIAPVAFVAVAFASTEGPISSEIDDDISNCATEKPKVKLEPLLIDSATFYYVIGARRRRDYPLYTNEYNSGIGDSEEDYQIRMNYPMEDHNLYINGKPSISSGHFTVKLSSKSNYVYVTSGGAGQKHISILVEAKNTTFLITKAELYGQK